MRLCRDCKHFSRIHGTHHFACNNERAKRDPVNGTAFAQFERSIIGNCGDAGKLFEQKPPRKTWFARIFGE